MNHNTILFAVQSVIVSLIIFCSESFGQLPVLPGVETPEPESEKKEQTSDIVLPQLETISEQQTESKQPEPTSEIVLPSLDVTPEQNTESKQPEPTSEIVLPSLDVTPEQDTESKQPEPTSEIVLPSLDVTPEQDTESKQPEDSLEPTVPDLDSLPTLGIESETNLDSVLLTQFYDSLKNQKADEAFEIAKQIVQSCRDENELYRLALVSIQFAKYDIAVSSLKKIIDINHKNTDAFILLISVMQSQKDISGMEALKNEQEFNVDKELIILLRARTAEAKEDAQTAFKIFKEGIEKYPKCLPLLYGMCQFLTKTNHPERAIPYFQTVIRLNKAEADTNQNRLRWARRTYAKILVSQKPNYDDQTKAINLLSNNIAECKRPDPKDAKLMASILASRNNPQDLNKAIVTLEDLMQYGNVFSPQEKLVLGQLYNRANNWSATKSQIQEIPPEYKNTPEFIVAFVGMLLKHNASISEMELYAQRMEQLQPDSLTTVIIESEVLHLHKQDLQAGDLLMKYFESLPEDKIAEKLAIASQLDRVGQFMEVEKAYRSIIQKNPKITFVFVDYLTRHNRIDLAIAELETLKTNKKINPDTILSAMLKVLRLCPHDPTPEQFKKVEKFFAQYEKQFKGILAFELKKAELKLLQRNDTEAQKLYSQIYLDSLKKKNVSKLQRAVIYNNLSYALSLFKKSPQTSLDYINEAITTNGPADFLLDTRALALLSFGEKDEKRIKQALTDMEHAVAAKPSAERLFHLARCYMKNEDEANATGTLYILKDLYDNPEDFIPRLERDEYKSLCRELGLEN